MKTRRLRALKLEIKFLIKSEMRKYRCAAVAVEKKIMPCHQRSISHCENVSQFPSCLFVLTV